MPIEDHIDRALQEIRESILRIESKLDARVEKVDERLRVLEQRIAQVWILGAFGTLVIVPLISYVVHKVVP